REEPVRLLAFTGSRERMGAQAGGALEVVLRVTRGDELEIGGGGLEVLQSQCAQRAAVERIDRVRLRDHPIEAVARPRELTVVEIQVAELLVIADRGIVEDQRFELLDALATRKDLECAAEQ